MIIKGVNKNLDLSVSGVLVFGDETFDDVTDYEYWFDTCTVSGLSGKVSYSRSDCCKTISVGKKMNKTSLQSTFLTMLLMWLYAVLTALLIGSFRIVTGRNIGIIVAGAIAAFSIFARDMGAMAFGEKVRFFAPLLWSAPIYLNWNGVTVMPTFIYAFSVYSIVIVLLLTVSIIRFQRYDIHDQSTNG